MNCLRDYIIQEYHYVPHSFGSGILAYRIKGLIHKFIYDGREDQLTWLVSMKHEKYYEAKLKELKQIKGLSVDEEILKKELNILTKRMGGEPD